MVSSQTLATQINSLAKQLSNPIGCLGYIIDKYAPSRLIYPRWTLMLLVLEFRSNALNKDCG